MASNNHLVLEIVFENSRAAVEEKQKQEISEVQTRYFELTTQAVLPTDMSVSSELRQKMIIEYVVPVYTESVTYAVRRGEYELTKVQCYEVQLDYYRKNVQRLERQQERKQELPTAP